MVASRPTVMAPPRSHAPPRAFLAHFNAQKMANARLKHASGSRLTLRSKTAQARRSLTATQELRDTFATIDAEGTWGFRWSPPRARPAQTQPARAADRRVGRPVGVTKPSSHSNPLKPVFVYRKEPFRSFRHSTWFPRRFRRFAICETARAPRKRSIRDWEIARKENLLGFWQKGKSNDAPTSLFRPGELPKRKHPRPRNVAFFHFLSRTYRFSAVPRARNPRG